MLTVRTNIRNEATALQKATSLMHVLNVNGVCIQQGSAGSSSHERLDWVTGVVWALILR